MKKRKDIEEAVEGNKINSNEKRLKGAANNIDKATLRWFHEIKQQNVPISGPMIAENAKIFASLLGNNEFQVSNGWITTFRKRPEIVFKITSGEEKSAPVNDALL